MKPIKGILYLDNSPVSIDIKDGIIQRIIKKQKLSSETRTPVFIAPGLIDHQVNG